MNEISLWLDYFDDIYSDFDSRHYLKRRISEDFLHELRLAKKYKKGGITDLVLFIPQNKRAEETEHIIVKSLNDFFKDQFQLHHDKYRSRLNRGILILLIAMVALTINSYINFKGLHSFPLSVIKVLLEPGGWFLAWLAFDVLFYELREIQKETAFFKELSEANIHFKTA